MKVLQVNTEKTWRGGERQTLFTLQGLKDSSIEVGLLCRRGFPLEKAARELGVPVYVVNSSLEAFFFLANNPENYDIYHPQTGKGHSLAAYSKVFHHKPIIYTRRVNFSQSGFLSKQKYRLTDQVVAISNAIKDTLNEFDVHDVTVISSAIEEKPLSEARIISDITEWNPERKSIIATTGDMVPQKDPLTMVETIRCLKEERNDFIFLHFGHNQMKESVFPLIEKYGLGPYYKCLGHIDGVEDYFAVFDIFLITSNETEGLCSSIYDAFIYKVPVVSTLTGGMFDSVGDRGLTCGPREPECLAKHLSTLIDDKKKRQTMADKAYTWAKENVTIESITPKYVELYKQVFSKQ